MIEASYRMLQFGCDREWNIDSINRDGSQSFLFGNEYKCDTEIVNLIGVDTPNTKDGELW